MQSGKSRAAKEEYRVVLVTRHMDTWELVVLLLAGVILFYLGWQLGRSTVEQPPVHSRPVHGRFGDIQQHLWIY